MSEMTLQAINAMRKIKLEPLSREVLEMTAGVMGANSAAAQALKEAEGHNGPVRFWKNKNTILVERVRPDNIAGKV